MIAVDLLLLIPLFGMGLMGLRGDRPEAGRLNVRLNALTLVGAIWISGDVLLRGPRLSADKFLYIDSFNVYLVALTAFVGLTTSIFSGPYMQHERDLGRIGGERLRLYYAMYQGFMLAMYLVLTTNNMGVMWVAMEGATLATVLLVSLYRTPESVEAAWKYFILCGVGIAQALFGTVLLYFAAEQIPALGDDALLWTALHAHAEALDPGIMGIAFVFLLVGYGTKIGLVPLHNLSLIHI